MEEPPPLSVSQEKNEKGGVSGGGAKRATGPTRATIEMHHFFSDFSSIWELKTSLPRTDLEKNKTATG